MQAATRFIATTLAIAAGTLALVAAMNARIDPFMQYHAPGAKSRFVTGFARHINAGLARNTPYNSVVLGSSYTMNFRNSDFDRAYGGKTVSFAMPGMFVSEGAKALRFAFNQRKIDHVFFGLDYFAFVEADNQYQFPDYLWDGDWRNDAPYLLSLDTLKRSAYEALGRGPANYNSDADMPWAWASHDTRFGRDKAVADFNDKRTHPSAKKYPIDAMTQVVERELLPLLAAHPQTQFDFFLPPYSMLTWRLDDGRGELNVLLAFRIALAEALAPYPHARLHDFQSWKALVCNLDRYTDVGHYGPQDNSAMVTGIRAGNFVVDRASMVDANERLSVLVLDRSCAKLAQN